jgi:Flp pilus assembly pilin Flp
MGKNLKFTTGQGLVEFALMLVFVSLVVILALYLFGPAIGNAYSGLTTTI